MLLLESYIAELEQMRQVTLDLYLADTMRRRATERTLQLALEASLDVGHSLIALRKLRAPVDNRDVFTVLGEAGVIHADLAARLERMAGFRNLLVHEYARLDDRRVYLVLCDSLGDLAQYAEAIARYVGL